MFSGFVATTTLWVFLAIAPPSSAKRMHERPLSRIPLIKSTPQNYVHPETWPALAVHPQSMLFEPLIPVSRFSENKSTPVKALEERAVDLFMKKRDDGVY
jgi:hypothetical protein